MLKRAVDKGLCGSVVNPIAVLALTIFGIILCALSFFIDAVYPKSDQRLTLLSAAVAETASVVQPALNESPVGAKPETARPDNTVDTRHDNSEQSGEWLIVPMRVTAYCPCEKCCGKYSDGVTACGHKIRPGDVFVAADKRYLFGTEMIIAGYGNGSPVKVLDRGGAIRGNRLDVFFHSHANALEWGVRHIDVQVHLK